jgi:hypothetical protein
MNKITNFLCLSLLLLGATALGMNILDEQLGRELLSAARNGSEDVCRLLIANKALVNAKDNFEQTSLICAACNGHKAICRLLIENKALVEAKDNYGWTPLSWAATNGYKDVCRLLIANKASVEAKDNDGLTSLFWAATNYREDVCKLLIDVQLESVKKNKATTVTFLGIVRKRNHILPCHMHYDVAKMIARQVFQLAKWPVVEQINGISNSEKRVKWLAYVNQQMNSVNK